MTSASAPRTIRTGKPKGGSCSRASLARWSDRCCRAATPAFGGAFLVLQERQLSQRQRYLEPIAAEHDRVDQALIEATTMLEKSRATIQPLPRPADVRSSSAVLAEVRRLVPETIVLDRLVLKSNALEISGSANQPNGLRLVNALLLRLSASGFFAPKRVELLQAVVSSQAEQATLRFSLSAGFVADAGLVTRNSLPLRVQRSMALPQRFWCRRVW